MLSEKDRTLIAEFNKMEDLDSISAHLIEIITRLEKALEKCREQRGICERVDHINGPCRFQTWDQELKDILEGEQNEI